jgi:hypothetical protein
VSGVSGVRECKCTHTVAGWNAKHKLEKKKRLCESCSQFLPH